MLGGPQFWYRGLRPPSPQKIYCFKGKGKYDTLMGQTAPMVTLPTELSWLNIYMLHSVKILPRDENNKNTFLQSECDILHNDPPVYLALIYMVIKKSLCAWWLQYRKLQVIFKVSPNSLQTFIDTRRTLMPSVIPDYNHIIIVSDWNGLKYFFMFFFVL
jgi:hypothetical protein